MRSFLSIAVLVSLAACAMGGSTYGELQRTYPAVSPNGARLFLYRESHYIAGGAHPDILLDGAKVRDSISGSYTMFDIAPGPHVVSGKMVGNSESRVAFNAAPGSTNYIEEEVGMSGIMGSLEFYQPAPDFAAQAMSSLHRRQPVRE